MPADLQQRIDEIDQRSRIIERKLELADEKSAEKSKESPVSAAGPGGFSIRSADKAHEVKIRGLLQFDVRRFFDDQTLEDEDRDTLLLRKVHPQIDATFLGIVDVRLVADFAGSFEQLIPGDAATEFARAPGRVRHQGAIGRGGAELVLVAQPPRQRELRPDLV